MNTRNGSILLLSILISACAGGPKLINDDYAWAVTPEYRDRILNDWFRCDECVNGQLRRVQELGNTAVGPLRDIVTEVEAGTIPSTATAKIAVIESSCTTVFNNMTARGFTPAETEAECIARYTANLQRRFRTRAIEALLAIRTREACAFIGEARCRGIPPFPDLEFELPTERSTRTMGIVL